MEDEECSALSGMLSYQFLLNGEKSEIIPYLSGNCQNNENEPKNYKEVFESASIREIPNYSGFKTRFGDEEDCPKRKYLQRIYYSSECDGNSISKIENDELILFEYSEENCKGEIVKKEHIGRCDSCFKKENGVVYFHVQCSSNSIWIEIIVIILFLLF